VRGAVGRIRGRINTLRTITSIPFIIKPAGDKCILANPVFLMGYPMGILRIGIYDTGRGRSEVGFEHDLSSKEFRISTYHVEIKRI